VLDVPTHLIAAKNFSGTPIHHPPPLGITKILSSTRESKEGSYLGVPSSSLLGEAPPCASEPQSGVSSCDSGREYHQESLLLPRRHSSSCSLSPLLWCDHHQFLCPPRHSLDHEEVERSWVLDASKAGYGLNGRCTAREACSCKHLHHHVTRFHAHQYNSDSKR
jgi:hypothetical protein